MLLLLLAQVEGGDVGDIVKSFGIAAGPLGIITWLLVRAQKEIARLQEKNEAYAEAAIDKLIPALTQNSITQGDTIVIQKETMEFLRGLNNKGISAEAIEQMTELMMQLLGALRRADRDRRIQDGST